LHTIYISLLCFYFYGVILGDYYISENKNKIIYKNHVQKSCTNLSSPNFLLSTSAAATDSTVHRSEPSASSKGRCSMSHHTNCLPVNQANVYSALYVLNVFHWIVSLPTCILCNVYSACCI